MNEKGNDFMTMFEEDENEHRKGTVHIDKVINADAKCFLGSLPKLNLKDISAWRDSFWMQYGSGTKN